MSTKTPTPPKTPIHWILDFDGTITQHDTLNTLVSIASSTSTPPSSTLTPPSSTLPPKSPTLWSSLTTAYLTDHTHTLSLLAPHGQLPSTLSSETQLLQDLRAVEQRSVARVSASGIFAGLTWERLHNGARKATEDGSIILRSGFPSFYQTIQGLSKPEMSTEAQSGEEITILSVNWSDHFIRSCLPPSPPPSSSPSQTPTILSNTLALLSPTHPTTPSNGHITPLLLSSGDKLRELQRLRSQDTLNRTIVYVGDSWTDIEALLAADVGICVRDEPMGGGQRQLADALGRLGVQCVRLGEEYEGDKVDGGDKVVWWVRGWEEIMVWREGLESV